MYRRLIGSGTFTFDLLYGASAAVNQKFSRRDTVPSLLDLTATYITTSWHIARACLSIVPHDLYEVLLGKACQALLAYKPGAPGLCLMFIVQRWPSAVLKLGSTMWRYRLDARGYKKTGELIMHIINGICKREHQCKLSVLDLSDISMDGDTSLKVLQKISTSLTSGTLTIVMDLTVDSENYQPIRRLLREVRKSKDGRLKVQCRRLILNSLGKDRVMRVLDYEEAQGIVALNLDMNRLENQGMPTVLPTLVQFINLQALSLTYNLINTTRDRTIGEMAAEAFSALRHLRRLSLSHNILTGSLRTLLESLIQPLQSLYVCDCRLSSADLSYLAHSRHAKSLQELDLSSNNLSHEAFTLEKLLSDAGDTLEYLGLDETHLGRTDSPVKLWTHLSHRLHKLVAVSMRGNDFTLLDQMGVQTMVHNMTTLVYIGGLERDV